MHAHTMICGLAILLIFQFFGEVVTRFIRGPIPGPVIGMILLLVYLVAKKKIAPSIALAADGLLAHLGRINGLRHSWHSVKSLIPGKQVG